MKFCGTCTITIMKVLKDNRFSIFKARCYLSYPYVTFSKMSKAGFYFFPFSDFRTMFSAESILNKWHRDK